MSSPPAAANERLEQLLGRGQAALRDGQLVEAQALFRAALVLAPGAPRVLALLGLACFRAGDFVAARPIFEELVELAPHDAAHRLNLGLVLLKLGDAEPAIAALETSRALDPSQGRTIGYLGLAYARAGRFAEAFRAFLIAGQQDLAREVAANLPDDERAAIAAAVGAASPPRTDRPAPSDRPPVAPAPPAAPEATRAARDRASDVAGAPRDAPEAPPTSSDASDASDARDASDVPRADAATTPSSSVAPEPTSPAGAAPPAGGSGDLEEAGAGVRGDAGPGPSGLGLGTSAPTPAPAAARPAAEVRSAPEDLTSEPPTRGEARAHADDDALDLALADALVVGAARGAPPAPTPGDDRPGAHATIDALPEPVGAAAAMAADVADEDVVAEGAEAPPGGAPPDDAGPAAPDGVPPFADPPDDAAAARDGRAADGLDGARGPAIAAPLPGASMVSTAISRATPSSTSVRSLARAASGARPPRPLSELATAGLVHADDGDATLMLCGSALVLNVRDRVYTRLAGVRAAGGELRAEPAHRRSRGMATDEPFDAGGGQLHAVTGRGFLVALPDDRPFTTVQLDDDILYLREELTFAFDATLRWESGSVPGLRGQLPIVQLRGDGAVAIRAARPLVPVKLPADGLMFVDPATLAGWIGRVVPRATAAARRQPTGALAIECTGEGIVLLDPGAGRPPTAAP